MLWLAVFGAYVGLVVACCCLLLREARKASFLDAPVDDR
jgi:hypothetical protein